MKTLTRKDLERIADYAKKNNNIDRVRASRKWTKERARLEIHEATRLAGMRREININDFVGKNVTVIYTDTNNLGTKSWPDLHTDLYSYEGVLNKITPKGFKISDGTGDSFYNSNQYFNNMHVIALCVEPPKPTYYVCDGIDDEHRLDFYRDNGSYLYRKRSAPYFWGLPNVYADETEAANAYNNLTLDTDISRDTHPNMTKPVHMKALVKQTWKTKFTVLKFDFNTLNLT